MTSSAVIVGGTNPNRDPGDQATIRCLVTHVSFRVTWEAYPLAMAGAYGRPASSESPWTAAARLAAEVAEGERLPELPSPVLLHAEEMLHAMEHAEAWRYVGLDVIYTRRQGVTLAGPIALSFTALATRIGNRRTRDEAGRLAAPQWRPLGHVPVMATSHRLLVLYEGRWASVWYNAIRQMRPALAQGRLELFFDEDAPYLLQGTSVPYLAVVIASALAFQVGPATVAAAVQPA
jgi:hypothetical protein